MKLEGTYAFEAPRTAVWEALQDPEILGKVIPGGEKLELMSENHYKATLKIHVGPVQGVFDGTVILSDLNAPESYRMAIDGKGASGFLNGSGSIRLEDQGATTVMHYDGEAQVGGRIASIGQRLLETTAKSLIHQSLSGLAANIQARQQAKDSNEPPPEIKPPSQAEFAAGVAKGVLDDLIPPDRRPIVAIGMLVFLFIFMLTRHERPRSVHRFRRH